MEKAAAFSYYNKGTRIRNLIHYLKYKGIKEIGYELGKIYGLSLQQSGYTEGMDFIIPVPLHPSKERLRGFNQSQIISEGLSEATGIPLNNEVLKRATISSTQTKRSRYERWTNVEGIFNISDPDSIKDKHILLVDDVITTGSTMESCINELHTIEGVKVSVVALGYSVM